MVTRVFRPDVYCGLWVLAGVCTTLSFDEYHFSGSYGSQQTLATAGINHLILGNFTIFRQSSRR
jgi:hypothetical protein